MNVCVVLLALALLGSTLYAAALNVQLQEARRAVEEKDALVAENNSLRRQLETIQQNHSALIEDYAFLNASYERLSEAYSKLETKYHKLESSYQVLNSSYNELLRRYSALNSSYVALLSRYLALNSSYVELLDQYSALNSSYNDLSGSYSALNSSYNELLRRYSALNSSYNELLAQYSALNSSYRDLLSQFIALNSSYAKLYSALYEPLKNETVPTVDELKAWLEEDPTDKIAYSMPNFVCGDFAVMLAFHAKMMGWDMGVVGILGRTSNGTSFNHAFNAIICKEGLVYVEPQTDEVWWYEGHAEIMSGEWYEYPGVGKVYVELCIIVVLYGGD